MPGHRQYQAWGSAYYRGWWGLLNCRWYLIHVDVVSGPPGSGKSTQSELLVSKYGLVHLSVEDLLREAAAKGTALGKAAADFLARGDVVPDDVLVGVVSERLGQADCRQKGWLLDAFPRTKAQAELLRSHGVEPDALVQVSAADEVAVEAE